MIQLTPQTRILVAVDPVDFRRGIDGLARICRSVLEEEPFDGALFVFRNRRSTSIKGLAFDGRGFWLFQKRLSRGKFRWWPQNAGETTKSLEAHELQVLFQGGDAEAAKGAPVWRPLRVPA